MSDWFGRPPDDHPEAVARHVDVERFADRHGLLYSRDVDESLLDPRFYLFSVGTGHVVGVGSDLVQGRWRGDQVTALDIWGTMIGVSPYAVVDPTGARRYPYAATVAMMDIDPAVPYIYMEHKDVWVRIADRLEHITHLPHPHLEVLTGNSDFDEEFDVRSAFGDRAIGILRAGLMDALLAGGRGFAFEVGYGRLLAYKALLPIEEWPDLFEAARTFVHHVGAAIASATQEV